MDKARENTLNALRVIHRLISSLPKVKDLDDKNPGVARWKKRARSVEANAEPGLVKGEEILELYGDLLILRDEARRRLK